MGRNSKQRLDLSKFLDSHHLIHLPKYSECEGSCIQRFRGAADLGKFVTVNTTFNIMKEVLRSLLPLHTPWDSGDT